MDRAPVVIIGAGPAGLTAAYELGVQGIRPVLLEKLDKVGGLARTEQYRGYHFDLGGHRFFTTVEEVRRLWLQILGEDFLRVSRLSRIYYRGQFFNYPLELGNALSSLGIAESARILLSYVRARLKPFAEEETFDRWVVNRFGQRLYQTFFRTYTEKVWGIPCEAIQADWASQRIRGLSLRTALSNALLGTGHVKTLISEFHYPRLGPGMMWQRLREIVEGQGCRVHLGAQVVRIRRRGHQVTGLVIRSTTGTTEVGGEQYLSSMPLPELIVRLDPLPPAEVVEAAHQLRYRAFILVGLILGRAEVFPDQWIYIHAPEVRVGRIQNFKNWSGAMVPDPATTSLGMEYFCAEGDPLWSLSDVELVDLASRELATLGLAAIGDVKDGMVIRQPKAYPVYDQGYRQRLAVIQDYLSTIDNLQTIGRNGMHRYNNQDHSMLTAMLAVRNLLGEAHDLWSVNTERSYYEATTVDPLQRENP